MKTVLKDTAYLVLALAFSTSLAAQAKKDATVADYVGTWNITMMSHQIALVIDPAEGNKVTATMMMMGNDVPLKGELVGSSISLVGVKTEGAEPNDHVGVAKPGGKPIVVTLQEDGTLAGEMQTNMGPAKWSGEKLKKKKS